MKLFFQVNFQNIYITYLKISVDALVLNITEKIRIEIFSKIKLYDDSLNFYQCHFVFLCYM